MLTDHQRSRVDRPPTFACKEINARSPWCSNENGGFKGRTGCTGETKHVLLTPVLRACAVRFVGLLSLIGCEAMKRLIFRFVVCQ